MAARPSIDVLDLASAKPTHRRTQSSKSSVLKALISPVKHQRVPLRNVASDTPSKSDRALQEHPENVSRRDRSLTRGLLARHGSTKAEGESPSKKQKENVDPFVFKQGILTQHIPTLRQKTTKVMTAVAAWQGKAVSPVRDNKERPMDAEAIDVEFEAMLEARNVAPHMREKMRSLTLRVKADLVKQEQLPGLSPTRSRDSEDLLADVEDTDMSKSTKRSRPRSRTFTFSRGDRLSDDSPTKRRRGRSKSRAEADVGSPTKSATPRVLRTEVPATYIDYLNAKTDPTLVEVGRLHKLRILIRNETVSWVDEFIELDGMSLVNSLLESIMAIEWREEHEDQLLHETLLCLKGLCTTASALLKLEAYAQPLLTSLLAMLFDPEKKGPAEYTTRKVIIDILFCYLASKAHSRPEELQARAYEVLSYLAQATIDQGERHNFVLDMHTPRPYAAWAKEVSNVTREVFWIFLHQLNVIPLERPSSSKSDKAVPDSFAGRHFPGARAPVPAAPYVGGVEWDATMYLTSHLDLLNGLVAALPKRESRNELRQQLQLSGFEKTMGTALRTCKEKFYAGIHDGLRAWVKAATEDQWPTDFVREGPSLEEQVRSARASPQKSGKKQAPPKLEEIKLDCPAFDLPGLTNISDTTDDWIG